MRKRSNDIRRSGRPKEGGSQAVVNAAIRQLSKWIESGRYPLHSRLPPERQLAEVLQIPRGRLREALLVLESDGRIWRCVGKGTFVGGRPQSVGSRPETLGSVTTLAEILEARSFVEPIIAQLAARRAESAEIDMIEHYAALAAKATSWAAWEQWDDLFHRAIAEASGNGLLINIVDHLFRIKMHPRWSVRQATVFDPDLVERYSDEHRVVIAHILSRDCGGAEEAMRRHMLGLTLTVGPALTGLRPRRANRA